MDHKIETPVKGPMRKSTKWIFVLLGVIIILALGCFIYYQYQQKQMQEAADLAAARDVTTTKVERGDLEVTLDDLSGTVHANQSVFLYQDNGLACQLGTGLQTQR